MRFLVSDRSLGRCDMLKAVLESNGIECVLKNEHMPFSGTGIGVFSPEPVYPELWVINNDEYDDAITILKEVEGPEASDRSGPEG